MLKEIPVTKQDPAAYLFDPETDPGPPDAGRDAVGASENPDPSEPEDAGCGCNEYDSGGLLESGYTWARNDTGAAEPVERQEGDA